MNACTHTHTHPHTNTHIHTCISKHTYATYIHKGVLHTFGHQFVNFPLVNKFMQWKERQIGEIRINNYYIFNVKAYNTNHKF